MSSDHGTIFFFIEHYAQFIQPFDSFRTFGNQLFQQFGLVGIVTTTQSIQIMDCRRVIFFISSLNTTFSHHSVSITDTQLGNDHYVSTVLVSFDRSSRTCTATTDYQYIYIIIDLVQINFQLFYTAVSLQQSSQLSGNLLTFVGTNLQDLKTFLLVVRMELAQYSFFLFCGQTLRQNAQTCGTSCFHLFDGF